MGPLEEIDPMCDENEEFMTGHRPHPVADIDRVLATVLFVDIVGSTEKAAGMGDRAWRTLLDSFRLRVRQEIERYHGREINSRGDDLLATFDGTTRAVRCAQAITNRVARELALAVRCTRARSSCTTTTMLPASQFTSARESPPWRMRTKCS
jgi:class 3 adenylate cyclase